jgi:hypothetical protein
MNTPDGVININFIDDNRVFLGTQQGLMMSFHHQTFVLTAFDKSLTHFTHAKYANFAYKDKNYDMLTYRYVYPFYIRIREIVNIGINNASEMNINFPNKNHLINNTIKIDEILKIEYNGWHIGLPPVYFHQIDKKYDLGSIIHLKNKITGMIVTYLKNTSLIISVFFIKQIIQSNDLNYANLYYTLDIRKNYQNKNEIYIENDWDIYQNHKLKKNDILLEIQNNPVQYKMYNDKIKEFVSIDTWITLMYLDLPELNIKIMRDNEIMNVKIPRIPLHNILQIKYYSSDPTEISFDLLNKNLGNER